MSMLMIQNNGEVDINALLLVGASTKEGDNTKIGFFGSGNKYALACLLRNNISFIIYSGMKRITIETAVIDLRGQSFEQIVIDGQPTSLTTRMGPQWVTWMALREFACNAIDEGGYVIDSVESEEPEEGYTKIYINMMPEVTDFYEQRWRYLEVEPPVLSVDVPEYGLVHFHSHKPGYSNRLIYRRGVRCSPLDDKKKALYRYDIPELSIGENRLFQSEWSLDMYIARAYYNCSDQEVIKKLLRVCTNKEYAEGSISWPDGKDEPMDQAWGLVLIDAKIAAQGFVPYMPVEDISMSTIVPDGMYAALKENFKELSFVDEPSHYKVVEGTIVQLATLQKAIDEVTSFGFNTNELTYKLVRFKDKDTLGQYHKAEVLISVDAIQTKPYDYIVMIVLEESMHHLGYRDGTREFEQHLLTQLIAAYRNGVYIKDQEEELKSLRLLKSALKSIGDALR